LNKQQCEIKLQGYGYAVLPPEYEYVLVPGGGYNLACKGEVMSEANGKPLYFKDDNGAAEYARLHQAGLLGDR
jgi:hypothetical protein